MSDGSIVVLIAAVWLAVGLGLAVFMGRRGHNAFGWGVIGVLLGPLGVALAIEAVMDEKTSSAEVLRESSASSGCVDVLVGIDGSPEAAAALHAAVDILGDRLHRLTLAGVRPYADSPADERWLRAQLDRQVELVRKGLRKGAGRCGVMLLTGRPSEELLRAASEGGYDLVVVGARGRGLSKALLGSVATQLGSNAKVPVLIAPAAA